MYFLSLFLEMNKIENLKTLQIKIFFLNFSVKNGKLLKKNVDSFKN